jgi:hypothetical protein
MTKLREAAQQALEALEWASDLNAVAQNHTPLHDAITALRAALAQQEQAERRLPMELYRDEQRDVPEASWGNKYSDIVSDGGMDPRSRPSDAPQACPRCGKRLSADGIHTCTPRA